MKFKPSFVSPSEGVGGCSIDALSISAKATVGTEKLAKRETMSAFKRQLMKIAPYLEQAVSEGIWGANWAKPGKTSILLHAESIWRIGQKINLSSFLHASEFSKILRISVEVEAFAFYYHFSVIDTDLPGHVFFEKLYSG